MSTLNLGGSPILKPMESGSGTLTATGFTVTYSYYKKDNVVMLTILFKPTTTIAVGTSTTTSNSLPASLIPKTGVTGMNSATNSGSGSTYPYLITIDNDGKANIFNFAGVTSAWTALKYTFTYLVNG